MFEVVVHQTKHEFIFFRPKIINIFKQKGIFLTKSLSFSIYILKVKYLPFNLALGLRLGLDLGSGLELRTGLYLG